MFKEYLHKLSVSDFKTLARCISLVENEAPGTEAFMASLPAGHAHVTGITGPPGAGKSTLTDALIDLYVKEGKKVAVLCVDPSSPFNLGALLGDRIRMSRWYDQPQVYIRSLATKGSLGGLHPGIQEITDVLNAAGFDEIIIETVGVGQSEIEIAGLADVTVVVIVPESGDEIQTMKAGVMEIADVFAVNKSDRPGADIFVKNLRQMLAPAFTRHTDEVEVIKTSATSNEGIDELKKAIEKVHAAQHVNDKKSILLAEKAYRLLQKRRMKDISIIQMESDIRQLLNENRFNLYQYLTDFK